eukprot:6214818-Pleurochrysis_carterae.AAC.11
MEGRRETGASWYRLRKNTEVFPIHLLRACRQLRATAVKDLSQRHWLSKQVDALVVGTFDRSGEVGALRRCHAPNGLQMRQLYLIKYRTRVSVRSALNKGAARRARGGTHVV